MPCFKPLPAYRGDSFNPETGKRGIFFSRRDAISGGDFAIENITVPCGQCRYCRLSKSLEWATRCTHEASLYQNNCFLTLTYSDKFLPKDYSVDYDAPVLFMKRLRKKFGDGIRSFGCAEYGEELSRPHYHLCVFNHDFYDKKLWKKSRENPLFRSADLEELWPFGHSTIGALTFESAAYVARYVTKKATGKMAEGHYERTNPLTGEVHSVLPEKSICVSRRPGIASGWYERYGAFSQNHDFIVSRGAKIRPPKYYDRLFDQADPEAFKRIKEIRKARGEQTSQKLEKEDSEIKREFFSHWTGSWKDYPVKPKTRLQTMEEIQEHKYNQLKRSLENGET